VLRCRSRSHPVVIPGPRPQGAIHRKRMDLCVPVDGCRRAAHAEIRVPGEDDSIARRDSTAGIAVATDRSSGRR
jgi:hypothetical protein